MKPSSLYDRHWSKARARHLAHFPLCALCRAQGRVVPATVVDHIRPHAGDRELFWNPENWQSLCKCCHDGTKRMQENTGRLRGSDAHGYPLDAQHPWFAHE